MVEKWKNGGTRRCGLKKNKKFSVACIQMNSQANLHKNILFAKNKIIFASKKGAKLILLPENCFLMAKNNKQFLEFLTTEALHPGVNEMKKIAKKAFKKNVQGEKNVLGRFAGKKREY